MQFECKIVNIFIPGESIFRLVENQQHTTSVQRQKSKFCINDFLFSEICFRSSCIIIPTRQTPFNRFLILFGNNNCCNAINFYTIYCKNRNRNAILDAVIFKQLLTALVRYVSSFRYFSRNTITMYGNGGIWLLNKFSVEIFLEFNFKVAIQLMNFMMV